MTDAAIQTQSNGIYVIERRDLTWRETDRKTIRIASVRSDNDHGKFLGYVALDQYADTGLHQHQGPAFSYFLRGGLSDFHGNAKAGEVGINLKGATHRAIAYEPTLLASRLEGPVMYPQEASPSEKSLHAGAFAGDVVNQAPEAPPDITVTPQSIPWTKVHASGVQRRMLFDYAQTDTDFRHVQLGLLAGSKLPAFTSNAVIDVFVIAGEITISDKSLSGGGFAVIEAGATVRLASDYGASCLIWSEAPVTWLDQEASDPLGF